MLGFPLGLGKLIEYLLCLLLGLKRVDGCHDRIHHKYTDVNLQLAFSGTEAGWQQTG